MAEERLTCAECGVELGDHQVGIGIFTTWGDPPSDWKPMKVWCDTHAKQYIQSAIPFNDPA